MKNINLPSSHKRSLSAVARSIEQSLNDVISLLKNEYPDANFNRIEKSYTKKQRQEIIDAVEVLHSILNEMVNDFKLDTSSSISENQILNAKFTHIWTLLHDSYSKKLNRYGELNKEAGSEIDKYIKRMLDALNTLQQICSK